MKVLPKLLSFEWDTGNIDKNFEKHLISSNICEEPFKDENLIIFPDSTHSKSEDRYHLIGKTEQNNVLFITYTLRRDKIRIISARIADKQERKIYENKKI